MERFRARDGKACLAALDARDKADRNAENLSTRPTSPIAMMRAQCVMLSGQCDAGKQQMRKAWQAQQGSSMGPEQIDNVGDQHGRPVLPGRLHVRARPAGRGGQTLSRGSQKKQDTVTCSKSWDTVKRLSKTVKPKDDDDHVVKSATTMHLQGNMAAMCLGRAGDCKAAFDVYREAYIAQMGPSFKDQPEILAQMTKPEQLRPTFDNIVSSCKGK